MVNVSLANLFSVTGRFQRSVHLERDFYTENALDGYVLTGTAQETLLRVVSALENGATSKAWSLTGPYGSGKSAFALFAAKLLGYADSPTTQQALELLKQGNASLYRRFISANGTGQFPTDFCPVLISGERAPITTSLLRGLEHGVASFNGTLPSNSVLQQIKNLRKTAGNGSPPQASDITAVFEAATQQICSDGGSGLLVVIDELGKFLEYAAQHPDHGDVFVLQDLAEFAARSGETPLLLLTILHQAFEQYAQRAAKSQREEWAKVQGRFEDVAFMEPTEQVLRLIGEALTTHSEIAPKPNFAIAVDLELKPRQLDESEFIQLLERCLPLHPTVALLIGPLFRRFAQNERSLFAFLGSNEPHGLQDFLFNQSYDGRSLPLFSLANLYDYINTAIGNRLYASRDSKKWAEIASAIQRLPEPSPMTVRLIKTIGLLGAVGEVIPNLKASKQVLRYALDDDTAEFAEEFAYALETLEKRSIVIYRRYNDAYAPWEGSDIDVEEKLREASTHIDPNLRVAANLSRLLPQRPLVAKRHLFQTGTMRYFAVRYSDFENFEADLHAPLEDADGLILYALPEDELEVKRLLEKASAAGTANRKNVLIAIPRSIGFLREAVLELARLRWVEEKTPGLDGDETARREISARLAVAEHDVASRLDAIFGENSEETCIWYHKGQPVQIDLQRARNAYLSTICDEVYDETPILQNELINRRKISGSVATARRKLIQAMLENGAEEKLGITGYPPEMSIYLSLLRDTGIHRSVKGVWGFHPPELSDKNRMEPTWKAIAAFLGECEMTRQPITKLYERLAAPPLGVRSGPLPILLCATILHYRTEIALYENGSFVADISMPVFERLIKAPEKFELKRFRLSGVRTDVLSQFVEVLKQPAATDTPDLLTIVAPLMRFIAELPKYTLLTQTLSEEAKTLRKTVLDAREPDALIFEQLPKAMGCPPFRADAAPEASAVKASPHLMGRSPDAFFKRLQDALAELGGAYDILLNSIEQLLGSAFALKQVNEALRRELASRAESLLAVTVETRLKGFLIRACDLGLDFTGWLEAIATFLANKPPSSWNDTDTAQFEVNLSELARKFHHFEAVSYENRPHAEQSPAGESIRIGITRPNQREQERVVDLPSTTKEQASELERAIEKVFEKFGVAENTEHCLAVIAQLSEKLMKQQEN
ncbi:hypothetical protein C6495_15215 [Candidatus Poribacteria bacterium]|nr:MAG: hypothetical protein C6495_15215 [Candidatus Poribacteria bacterium]